MMKMSIVVAVAADEEVCCPKCGNRLPVGLNAFCDWCGYPLWEVEIEGCGGPALTGTAEETVFHGVREDAKSTF
jgi:predicted amidophosphoribosyltransferase